MLILVLLITLTGCADVLVVGDYNEVNYTKHVTAESPEQSATDDDAAWAAFIYGAFAIMCILLMAFIMGFGRPKW
jgi:hypothetical protein